MYSVSSSLPLFKVTVAFPVPSVSVVVSEMSLAVKPVTASLKVIVTSNAPFCGLFFTSDDASILTVGFVSSTSMMVIVTVMVSVNVLSETLTMTV